MKTSIGRLHVLTDYHFQQRFSHAELARRAIQGGADTVQFRQKSGAIQHVLREAEKTAAVCRELGVPILINDRIDTALACEATGVHLGQSDFPIHAARRILGYDAIIGATATTLVQALRAQEEGADYVGFGPVFETGSKANPASVKGLTALSKVCSELSIPVIAIAGITANRIERVLEAGAYGVAVMTAVSTSDDPSQAAREIRNAIDQALQPPAASAFSGSHDGRRDTVG